jgi:hypothetical protein
MAGFKRVQVHLNYPRRKFVLEEPTWNEDGLSGFSNDKMLDTHLPWKNITKVERPRGRKTGLGVAMGAGTGLVAAVIAGLICTGVHDSGDGQEIETTCGDVTLTTALIAIPIGAVTGGLIGSRRLRWEPIYCFEEGDRR